MGENSYNLQTILLLQSDFLRSWVIDFENPEFKDSLDINVEDIRGDDFINVMVDLKFSAGVNEDKQIKANIKMVGVFSTTNAGDLSIDQFATINAPAIIFPFLREHLSSLSVKAGLSPILLAPVNFVKRVEKKS